MTIELRKYAGDIPGVTLIANLQTLQVTLVSQSGTEKTPIDELEHWLHGYIRRFGVS